MRQMRSDWLTLAWIVHGPAAAVRLVMTSLIVKNCAGAGAGNGDISGAMLACGGTALCVSRVGAVGIASAMAKGLFAAWTLSATEPLQPDTGNLGVGSSVCVNRGCDRDETEGQRDQQPASRVLRPCLRTHVQHPVSGALTGFCNKAARSGFFTELAIRPGLLRPR